MSKLRLFLAVTPPPSWKRYLSDIQHSFREAVPPNCSRAVKWVALENIHLTLIFLGAVDEGSVLEICTATKKAVQGITPFELRMGESGFFTSSRGVRVIWMGMEQSASLQILHERLNDALKNHHSGGHEEKEFRPHLTLARVKAESLPRHDSKALTSSLEHSASRLARPLEEPWPVDGVQLFQSELLPGGPRYSVLSEFKLGK